MRPNVLLITLDQFRGDSLGCAGHPQVRTPNLDALAAEGVRFARHYAQAAPCAPGRAALYTGTYQMNNRVVANGTPLDWGLDNVARLGLREGYHPVMWGYTDQGADIRRITDPDDPRLRNWEGVLPGFEELLCLDERHAPWLEWLRSLGYDATDPDVALDTEHERPAEHSVTQFLTDHFLSWLDQQDGPWFAHTSYIRPHPPYDAAGHYATMYDPAECPPPLPVPADRHPVHDTLLQVEWTQAPTEPHDIAHLRAQMGDVVGLGGRLGPLHLQQRVVHRVPVGGHGQRGRALGRVVHRGVVAGGVVRRMGPDVRGVCEPRTVLLVEPRQEVVGEELRDRVLGGAFVLGVERDVGVGGVVPERAQPLEPWCVALVEAQQLLEAGEHAFPVAQARIVGVGDAPDVGTLVGVPPHHRVVALAQAESRHVVEAPVEWRAIGDHAVVHLVRAGVQRGAPRRARCCLRVVPGESNALGRQCIEVRRAHLRMAGAAEGIAPELVERDEEYVRAHAAP